MLGGCLDAWMTRPDLCGNYGGWQALDTTLQEVSGQSGTMVTVLALVRAVKDSLYVPYNTKFVIAEVICHCCVICYWRYVISHSTRKSVYCGC